MSARGFATAVAAKSLTEPELLLAASAITSSGAGFQDAVERIERLLVDAAVCTGLVVLERRGEASFPIAGKGGTVPATSPETILSRDVKAHERDVQVVLLSGNRGGHRSGILADFLAEQIGALLAKDHLLDRRDALKDRLTRLRQELAALKLVARAKGLLISKLQLSERAAGRWIENESRRTGVSSAAVARQIIAAYLGQPGDATPDSERKTA